MNLPAAKLFSAGHPLLGTLPYIYIYRGKYIIPAKVPIRQRYPACAPPM